MDLRNRQYRRIHWFFVAGNNGLQGLGDVDRRHHRVCAFVRQCSVRALAMHFDFELIGRRHHWPSRHGKCTHGRAWPIMQAENRVHRKLGKQAVFYHGTCATTTFFSGLKHEVHSAFKCTVLAQVFSRTQQHGGVPVVSTGVHFACIHAGVGECIVLLHGQGIHVGA